MKNILATLAGVAVLSVSLAAFAADEAKAPAAPTEAKKEASKDAKDAKKEASKEAASSTEE